MVSGLIGANPAMLTAMIEKEQRVLVIFALKNPEIFSTILGGETAPKEIVTLIKANPDMALELAMDNSDKIVSFAIDNPQLILKYADQYKYEILDAVKANPETIQKIAESSEAQEAVMSAVNNADVQDAVVAAVTSTEA